MLVLYLMTSFTDRLRQNYIFIALSKASILITTSAIVSETGAMSYPQPGSEARKLPVVTLLPIVVPYVDWDRERR